MKYQLKEHVWSWTNTYDIKHGNGELAFQVVGKFLSWGKTCRSKMHSAMKWRPFSSGSCRSCQLTISIATVSRLRRSKRSLPGSKLSLNWMSRGQMTTPLTEASGNTNIVLNAEAERSRESQKSSGRGVIPTESRSSKAKTMFRFLRR